MYVISAMFRFSVKWEILRQDTRQDLSTDIKGMSFIDVPANGKKDYKLNVFAYKETTLPLKVGIEYSPASYLYLYMLWSRWQTSCCDNL